jgi:hypothetical protein
MVDREALAELALADRSAVGQHVQDRTIQPGHRTA